MYDSRDDVPETHRFDLTRIFDGREDWADAADALAESIETFDTDRPVGDVLADFEALSARDHRLRTYASLRADVATGDDDRAADRDRAERLHGDVMRVRDDVERRVREADYRGAVPSRFSRYVADIERRADRALDPAASDLLAALDDVLDAPKRVHRALVDRDFDPPEIEVDGEAVVLTRSERSRIQSEGDRDVRRRAFEAVREAFRDRRATLAANLDTMARRNVRLADARGYDSALDAALAGDDPYVACRPQGRLPTDTYDALVAGVRANLDPKHRLQRLRREALGVETLRPWDLQAAPVDGDAPRYDFDEARDLILDAVSPLGEAYRARLEVVFGERRVDAFDHAGKTERGAGYATHAPGAGPFVLARWDGSLGHLFLLAHELGHAVHSSFADDAQPHVTSGIPGPTAELPSKLHEVLLVDQLLDATTGDERAAVATRAMRSVGANLFYSARWSAFTHHLHERVAAGDRLTADWLDETYGDLFAEFDPVVAQTDGLRAGWTTGLYGVPLYHHYPYILGTAGALAVADGLGGKTDPTDYVAFLEAGTSAPAVELLADLGVDAASESAVSRAVSRFDDYVDAFADSTW
ncbi:M3 family oligoendopeptidase [Halobacterium litoreum]|uniref:M3 family oligoendopeptidase n=1 Tax=Halobacterium litoreum TaxID=2039234 RepID=A0ABD5NI30_9EURY|nr:M3 family metallopeptidase [Halobacterium litoreum]UHH12391.1 M3 family metallopeptidase [Halobacterium litoreum]